MSKGRLGPVVGGTKVSSWPGVTKGHQPGQVRPGLSTATGGFQPTSQGGSGTPPTQGSGGKK
jgi:hypothetical protein